MSEQPFILNNRFVVNPATGIIRDGQKGKDTHIGSRPMHLLYLLALNNERVVAAADIIKEVWDEGGHAGKELAEAITALEKILSDEHTSLIETLPKKGYVLHAKVIFDNSKNELEYVHGKNRGKYILIAAAVFVLALGAFLIIRSKQSHQRIGPDLLPAMHKPVNVDTTGMSGDPDKLPDTVVKLKTGAEK